MLRTRVATSLCAIVAVGSIAGVALAADSNGVGPLTAIDSPPTTAVSVVQPDAAASFKLLRTTAPTGLPAEVTEAVGSPTRYGRNPALARAIKTATGDTGWVIPGDGYLCIAVADPGIGWGTSCLPTAVAAQRGLSIGLTSATGKTAETLLVPDGARVAKVEGPVSTAPPVATASSKTKSIKIGANGVAIAHTNAPGSLRVKR